MSIPHLLSAWVLLSTVASCSAAPTNQGPHVDNYYIFPVRLKQSVPLVRHGRRLTEASGKVDIDGSVRVGYFYAVLPLGTPAKTFDVIVDTGSTVTYVPCNDCKHCGKHNDVPFNPSESKTSRWISCGDQQCRQLDTYYCDRVQYPGQCVYRIAYAEQSTSEGRLVQDMFTLPDSQTKIPVTFGCVEGETGEIFKQKPDGIVGMGNSPGAFHSQLAAAGAIPHVFSLCFGFPSGGALLLGNAPIPGNPSFAWTPFSKSGWGDFYSVDMDRITIGGKALDVPEYAFNSGYRTVLDSGTTFIYLTTPLYRKFAAVIRAAAVAAGLRETTDSYGDICWTGAAANWEELSRLFPTASMSFVSGAELQLPPYRYMFQLSAAKGTYCLAVFDNGGAGSLIGGVATRNVLVKYDIVNQRVGFADVDCQALGELPSKQFSTASSAAAGSTQATAAAAAALPVSIKTAPATKPSAAAAGVDQQQQQHTAEHADLQDQLLQTAVDHDHDQNENQNHDDGADDHQDEDQDHDLDDHQEVESILANNGAADDSAGADSASDIIISSSSSSDSQGADGDEEQAAAAAADSVTTVQPTYREVFVSPTNPQQQQQQQQQQEEATVQLLGTNGTMQQLPAAAAAVQTFVVNSTTAAVSEDLLEPSTPSSSSSSSSSDNDTAAAAAAAAADLDELPPVYWGTGSGSTEQIIQEDHHRSSSSKTNGMHAGALILLFIVLGALVLAAAAAAAYVLRRRQIKAAGFSQLSVNDLDCELAGISRYTNGHNSAVQNGQAVDGHNSYNSDGNDSYNRRDGYVSSVQQDEGRQSNGLLGSSSSEQQQQRQRLLGNSLSSSAVADPAAAAAAEGTWSVSSSGRDAIKSPVGGRDQQSPKTAAAAAAAAAAISSEQDLSDLLPPPLQQQRQQRHVAVFSLDHIDEEGQDEAEQQQQEAVGSSNAGRPQLQSNVFGGSMEIVSLE